MRNTRHVITAAVAVIGAAVVWHGMSAAQVNAGTGPGVVTVFDHGKLDASFAKALANGGKEPIWDRTSNYGTSEVSVHMRDQSEKSACPTQGCGHKVYTAVVIVTSGSATLVVGGTTKAAASDKFGGQLIGGGGSHRISQGDIFIMPPDTPHWYKDVAGSFRYIEVPVP